MSCIDAILLNYINQSIDQQAKWSVVMVHHQNFKQIIDEVDADALFEMPSAVFVEVVCNSVQ